jgi:hypothetical protein
VADPSAIKLERTWKAHRGFKCVLSVAAFCAKCSSIDARFCRWSARYAAGRLFPSSCVHNLLSQVR